METTTTEITLQQSLAKLSAGDVVLAYEKNLVSLSKAKSAYLEKYAKMEYNAENAAVLEEFETKMKKYGTDLNAVRSPLTRELDEIKKMFTVPEKEWKELGSNIASKRLAWKQAEQKKIDDAKALQAKENEKLRVKAEFLPELELYIADKLLETKQAYLKAVQDKNEEAIANPFIFTEDTYLAACNTVLIRINGNEHRGAAATSVKDLKQGLITGFNEKFTDFRKEVFKSKDKPAALQNLFKQMGMEYGEEKEALTQKKEEAVLNHEIDKVEANQLILQPTAGAPAKIKEIWVCKPKDFAEFMKLAAYWYTNDGIQVEELFAVFSKAITMANRIGAKGGKIDGITFVKDVR